MNDPKPVPAQEVVGRKAVATDSPAELASWYFPHDDQEEQRRNLAADIEDMIERRVGEAGMVVPG